MTDAARAMDRTGLDWRPQYQVDRRNLQRRVAEYERQKVRYADRIGAPANEDNGWFDKLVDSLICDDGTRLTAIELSDLGQEMVRWTRAGRLSIITEVLAEMERAMLDGDVEATTARDMALELLDGLQAELLEIREEDADGAKAAEATIRQAMGYETQQLWIPMWSGTIEFIGRRKNL